MFLTIIYIIKYFYFVFYKIFTKIKRIINLRAIRMNRVKKLRWYQMFYIIRTRNSDDRKKLTPLDGHIAYQWITDTIVLESIFDFKILTSYPYD